MKMLRVRYNESHPHALYINCTSSNRLIQLRNRVQFCMFNICGFITYIYSMILYISTRSLHFYHRGNVILHRPSNFHPNVITPPPESYDVISIFEDGGQCITSLLPALGY